MMHHIVKVQPIIGNKKEWSKHYEQHLEMEKKLRTHNKELFNLKEFRDQLTRGKKTRLVKLDQKEERLNQT